MHLLRQPQEFSETIRSGSFPKGRVDGTFEVVWDSDMHEAEDNLTLTNATKHAMVEAGFDPNLMNRQKQVGTTAISG